MPLAGLSTRNSTAQFVVSLVASVSKESLRPFAGVLLSALGINMEKEESTAVRKSFADAAAKVAIVANDESIERYDAK